MKVVAKANIMNVFRNRKGKTKLIRNRFFGLTKKIFARNAKRCPFTETQEKVAKRALESAQGIEELNNALLFILDERTRSNCPKINVNLRRKLNKVANKAKNQTFSK